MEPIDRRARNIFREVKWMIGKALTFGLVCAGMALGQTTTAPVAANTPVAASAAVAAATTVVAAAVPAKAYTFDVVSIRQNISGDAEQFGPTPDGYRMTNMTLELPIMSAYVPQIGGPLFFSDDQIKGFPVWMMTERYDISARIAEEDRAEWQSHASQKVMLQVMMRALLEDRCKMVVHREVKEAAVYSLVVGKKGPKFRETNPDVAHPGGEALPWGGIVVFSNRGVSLYGTSMASLASILSQMMNMHRPILDKTGLTGRYDIVLKEPEMGAPPVAQQSGSSASDPSDSFTWVSESTGLKLESTKGQVETLVIDHMERPSSN
jgi:uncharacterized protein (TIGR03435 family)